MIKHVAVDKKNQLIVKSPAEDFVRNIFAIAGIAILKRSEHNPVGNDLCVFQQLAALTGAYRFIAVDKELIDRIKELHHGIVNVPLDLAHEVAFSLGCDPYGFSALFIQRDLLRFLIIYFGKQLVGYILLFIILHNKTNLYKNNRLFLESADNFLLSEAKNLLHLMILHKAVEDIQILRSCYLYVASVALHHHDFMS